MSRRLPEDVVAELRARWRDQHICLRCRHHIVCKVASAAPPELLVAIAQCAAFELIKREPAS